MFVDFKNLPDDSKIWVYGSEQNINSDTQIEIGNILENFLNDWSHHGNTLTSSYEFIENRFLVIGIDQSFNPTGGCSIDKLQNLILKIDNTYGFNFYQRLNVFVKIDDKIECIKSSELKDNISVDKNSFFYNLNITTKQELNSWLIQIKDGWCSRFLN